MNSRLTSVTSTTVALLLIEAVLLGQEQLLARVAAQYDCGQILESAFVLVTQMVHLGRLTPADGLRMRGYLCDWEAVRDLAVTDEDLTNPNTPAWQWSSRLAHSGLTKFDGTLPLISCQERTPSGICASVVGTAYTLAAFARVEMAVACEELDDFLLRYTLVGRQRRSAGSITRPAAFAVAS